MADAARRTRHEREFRRNELADKYTPEELDALKENYTKLETEISDYFEEVVKKIPPLQVAARRRIPVKRGASTREQKITISGLCRGPSQPLKVY